MAPKIGELQITNNALGQPIAGGKVLWLYGYETIGGVELDTGTPLVAVRLLPGTANPDFKEPIVVMLAVSDIENFIKAIRIAEAGLHPGALKGGTA
jgi:hypothetical protein